MYVNPESRSLAGGGAVRVGGLERFGMISVALEQKGNRCCDGALTVN